MQKTISSSINSRELNPLVHILHKIHHLFNIKNQSQFHNSQYQATNSHVHMINSRINEKKRKTKNRKKPHGKITEAQEKDSSWETTGVSPPSPPKEASSWARICDQTWTNIVIYHISWPKEKKMVPFGHPELWEEVARPWHDSSSVCSWRSWEEDGGEAVEEEDGGVEQQLLKKEKERGRAWWQRRWKRWWMPWKLEPVRLFVVMIIQSDSQRFYIVFLFLIWNGPTAFEIT